MEHVKLVLRQQNRNRHGKAPVYLQYTYDRDRRTLINTGKYVAPEDWNPARGEVRRTCADHKELNQSLHSFRVTLERMIDELRIKGVEPTLDMVRTTAFRRLRLGAPKEESFYAVYEAWVELRKEQVGRSVIVDYGALLKHLKGFEQVRKAKVGFSSINNAWIEQFVAYLEHDVPVRCGKVGLMKSSVWKQVKNLKVFLKHAFDQGLMEPFPIRVSTTRETEAMSVYLSTTELDILEQLDLSDDPDLERTRDLFLIGCETGLRFSDYSDLGPEHFVSGKVVKPARKTGRKVVIPMSPRLQRILLRYGHRPPRKVCSLHFNIAIKEVCKLAGLDSPCLCMEYRGTRKQEVIKPKYELVSSHTARRSFCTNLYLLRVPSATIRRISGHRTEKAFLRYIRIDEEEAAIQLEEFWRRSTELESCQPGLH